MKKIKTKILLLGLSFEKPEVVEVFEGTEKELKSRLYSLQEGYCENEKPRFNEFDTESGKTIIECSSDSDYYYAARLK